MKKEHEMNTSSRLADLRKPLKSGISSGSVSRFEVQLPDEHSPSQARRATFDTLPKLACNHHHRWPFAYPPRAADSFDWAACSPLTCIYLSVGSREPNLAFCEHNLWLPSALGPVNLARPLWKPLSLFSLCYRECVISGLGRGQLARPCPPRPSAGSNYRGNYVVAHMINQHLHTVGSCLLLPFSPLSSSSIRDTSGPKADGRVNCAPTRPTRPHLYWWKAIRNLCRPGTQSLCLNPSLLFLAPFSFCLLSFFHSLQWTTSWQQALCCFLRYFHCPAIVFPSLASGHAQTCRDSGHLIDDAATNGCPSKLHSLSDYLINELLHLVRVVSKSTCRALALASRGSYSGHYYLFSSSHLCTATRLLTVLWLVFRGTGGSLVSEIRTPIAYLMVDQALPS